MPVIERTVRPRRNRVSVDVPREFNAYTCRVIVVPLQEVVHESRGGKKWNGQLQIGSFKDEIILPDDFEQEFEGLDGQVAAMFEGAAL